MDDCLLSLENEEIQQYEEKLKLKIADKLTKQHGPWAWKLTKLRRLRKSLIAGVIPVIINLILCYFLANWCIVAIVSGDNGIDIGKNRPYTKNVAFRYD